MIHIKEAYQIRSSGNEFKNCYIVEKGAIWYMETIGSGQFEDEDSSYYNSAALYGGVLYADSVNVSVKQATAGTDFIQNVHANKGGFAYMKGTGTLEIEGYSHAGAITDVSAVISGGLVHYEEEDGAEGPFTISLTDCTLDGMEAKNQDRTSEEAYGGVLYVDTDYTWPTNYGTLAEADYKSYITISDVTGSDLYATTSGSLVHLEYFPGDVTIENCDFSDFEAGDYGSLFYSTSDALDLTVTGGSFQCSTEFAVLDYCETATSADACWSEAVIDTLLISSPVATRAGAFYISEAIRVESTGNDYSHCYVCNEGAVYTLTDVDMFEESGGSTYTFNAAINGGAIKCDGCTMELTGATFYNNTANSGGTFFFDNLVDVTLESLVIYNSAAYEDGGALAVG